MPSWYKSYPWLHVCCTSLKVYCYYCRHASFSNLSVMSTKGDLAFSTEGFCKWKKGLGLFKTHELSYAHKDALSAYNALKSVPISPKLQKKLDAASEKPRLSLLYQLRVLHCLLRRVIHQK